MNKTLRKFTDAPMETYLVLKGVFGGLWFMTHPFTFLSVIQSWSELQALGEWFPWGAAAFWGLMRVCAGVLHLLGITLVIRGLRLVACAFSCFFYFFVAVCMLLSNHNDPSLAEYLILSFGAAWMYLLIHLKGETLEGHPFHHAGQESHDISGNRQFENGQLAKIR